MEEGRAAGRVRSVVKVPYLKPGKVFLVGYMYTFLLKTTDFETF